MPGFLVMALRTSRQTVKARGNMAAKVLRDGPRTFWTMTSWESEAAMRDFMLAGAHRVAMRKLLDWCDEASLVHWAQAETALPAWTEAHARMQREGRPSKVNHPSEAQRAYQVPAPADLSRGEQRLK